MILSSWHNDAEHRQEYHISIPDGQLRLLDSNIWPLLNEKKLEPSQILHHLAVLAGELETKLETERITET